MPVDVLQPVTDSFIMLDINLQLGLLILPASAESRRKMYWPSVRLLTVGFNEVAPAISLNVTAASLLICH